jgi:hypothetical protein
MTLTTGFKSCSMVGRAKSGCFNVAVDSGTMRNTASDEAMVRKWS